MAWQKFPIYFLWSIILCSACTDKLQAAATVLSLSLLCFQFYLLFLPEFPVIFTHYSYFIPIPSPIIPVSYVYSLNFYCVSDNEVHSFYKWVAIPS